MVREAARPPSRLSGISVPIHRYAVGSRASLPSGPDMECIGEFILELIGNILAVSLPWHSFVAAFAAMAAGAVAVDRTASSLVGCLAGGGLFLAYVAVCVYIALGRERRSAAGEDGTPQSGT
jgi:hypothetical protein